MTSLMKDIESVMSSLVVPAFKVKIVNDWRDNLALSVQHGNIWKDEEVFTKHPQIAEVIRANTILSVDIKTGAATLTTSKRTTESIWQTAVYQIKSDVCDFIRLHAGYQNYRLSALYKWYNAVSMSNGSTQQMFLIEDLYALQKYVQANGPHSKNSEHTKTAVKLLHIIKDRYESKV